MAVIQNLRRLQEDLRKRVARAITDDEASVVVGYTQQYAIFVHENLEMKLAGVPRTPPRKGSYWDPQGQAGPKFLEQPAREMSGDGTFANILRTAAKKGLGLMQGLLLCGLRLQRESMLRVPVDTGNLKASAFTRQE